MSDVTLPAEIPVWPDTLPLPRIEGYLRRNLDHPALEELKAWYQAHMPKLFETEAAD